MGFDGGHFTVNLETFIPTDVSNLIHQVGIHHAAASLVRGNY